MPTQMFYCKSDSLNLMLPATPTGIYELYGTIQMLLLLLLLLLLLTDHGTF